MTKEYIEREKAIEWFMAFVHMGESDIPAETVISAHFVIHGYSSLSISAPQLGQ